MRSRPAAALAVAACALGLVAGCTSGGKTTPTPDVASTITTTRTVTSSATAFQPPPVTSVAPLPPAAGPPTGEREGNCPYIASSPDQDANTNVADIVGSHVYRTTVSIASPVSCRFFFYSSPYGAIADIVPRSFSSALDARNAMIRTGEQGTQVIGLPSLAPGVQGVSYRSLFYGPDDGLDWACAFAKGVVVVVVHTQRTDTAQVAVLLAQAVIPRF